MVTLALRPECRADVRAEVMRERVPVSAWPLRGATVVRHAPLGRARPIGWAFAAPSALRRCRAARFHPTRRSRRSSLISRLAVRQACGKPSACRKPQPATAARSPARARCACIRTTVASTVAGPQPGSGTANPSTPVRASTHRSKGSSRLTSASRPADAADTGMCHAAISPMSRTVGVPAPSGCGADSRCLTVRRRGRAFSGCRHADTPGPGRQRGGARGAGRTRRTDDMDGARTLRPARVADRCPPGSARAWPAPSPSTSSTSRSGSSPPPPTPG
jgi:hypothetical protein